MEFEKALEIMLHSVSAKDPEMCDLDHALGRVLARDIASHVTLPMHDSAFKDGFAVRYADVQNATPNNIITLPLKGESFAGGAYQPNNFALGAASKITTGAYLPNGLDTVIPWEDVKLANNHIYVDKPVKAKQDVTQSGAELNAGEILLTKGTALKPADIGLAAAGGNAQLLVTRMPSVGIISTGNELVMPGNPLGNGQIYSSNQFQLKTQTYELGMKACAIIIKDDFSLTEQGVASLLFDHDVLISSGGSADSEKDFMPRVLKKLSWDLLVQRINIKPGHTLKYGLLQGKPFFVLPGTPSGTEVCFNLFVIPLLRKLAGNVNVHNTTVYAKLTGKIKGAANMKSVSQVVVTFAKDGVNATTVPKNYGRIKSIAKKNALVIVPQGGYNEGDVVECIMQNA